MLMPTKILVPTDFSEYSDRALQQALDIGKQYHSKVFLLHVIHEDMDDFLPIDFGLSYELWRSIKDRHLAETEEKMQNQIDKFPQAKEVEVVTNVRRGISYDEILKEGEEKGIDLIVIASLGKTGIAKYLIGSVARNVLRGSKCPVLLTK
jgi:nucleotide-binding universal stress UspA family protein